MNKRRKKIIGILGGIGSGKSTAAEMLGRLGCRVIDADKIAHKISEKKIIKKELQRKFGSGIIDKKGRIDRIRLIETAFSSRQNAGRLNRIIHPPVLAEIEQLIKKYRKEPHIKAIAFDIALLAEIGWTKRCDEVIFVKCSRKNRFLRGKEKGIFSRKKVKILEKFQISLDTKEKIAENTIDNNGSITNLKKQIVKIFPRIMENG